MHRERRMVVKLLALEQLVLLVDCFSFSGLNFFIGNFLSNFCLYFKIFCCFFSALALQFLHANNIAHMDLKPQNLLLSARENPVLKLAGNVCKFLSLIFHSISALNY